MIVRMKKFISYILLILWMILIFILSHQTSDISGGVSGSLIYDTLFFICDIFNLNVSNLNDIVEIIHSPIRELMHALEYFILGILVVNVLKQNDINKNLLFISILFCFIYSLTDEVHQLFISGRTFQLLDLFMDFIGYTLGSLLFNKFIK